MKTLLSFYILLYTFYVFYFDLISDCDLVVDCSLSVRKIVGSNPWPGLTKDIESGKNKKWKNISFILTDTLSSFNNSNVGGPSNVDSSESLKEAKRILAILTARNFSGDLGDAEKEKESAVNATRIADKLKEQATVIEKRASEFNNTFKDLLEAFKHLKVESEATKENATDATAIVDMAKDIEYKVMLLLLFCQSWLMINLIPILKFYFKYNSKVLF